ncbi:MAG: dockerin type I domain-containing protein [Planctomycetota bacterium]|jgi:hypothetical protein
MKTALKMSLLILLASAMPAAAGPAWVEGGDGDDDAGALPQDAQATAGPGTLITISGSLAGAAGAAGVDDFEDMYVIRIDDPASFSATTAFFPGSAEFDSRLYLFTMNGGLVVSGFGLLGNEDTGGPPPGGLWFGGLPGACCFPDGSCGDGYTEGACIAEGGVFQGAETSCDFAECPEAFGACCFGVECDERFYIDCVKSGGVFQGDGTTCEPGTCGEDFGACCTIEGCFETTASDCAAVEGIFLGDGTDCESDECPDPEGSTMGNSSTDGFPAEVTEPGLYFLAITVTPRQPTSPGGPIFFFADPNEVSGPDGTGGSQAIDDWQEPVPASIGDVPGNYTIYLGGVEFSGSLCPWDLDGDGYVTLMDLLDLLHDLGPCPPAPEPCPADFDGDGEVSFLDALELIQNLGPCPSDDPCPWDFDGDGAVGPSDVAELFDHLGPCDDPGNCPWDLNGNGVVCIIDVLILLSHWGPCT